MSEVHPLASPVMGGHCVCIRSSGVPVSILWGCGGRQPALGSAPPGGRREALHEPPPPTPATEAAWGLPALETHPS